MALEFTLPDVGEGVAEGEIVQWLVGPGDPVTEDQPVVEVETDKAVVEVPSPVDGTVKEIRAEAGDVVPVGEVIIVFDVDGEPDDVDAAVEPEPAPSEPETAARSEAESGSSASGRVFAAPSARRLARELGVDIATVDGTGPGGRVTDRDVREAAESGGGGEPEQEPAPEAVAQPEPEREPEPAAKPEPEPGADSETQAAADDAATDSSEAADAEADEFDIGIPEIGDSEAGEPEGGDAADRDGDERDEAIAAAEEPLGGAQPTVAEGKQPTTEDAGVDPTRDRTLAAPATRRLAEDLEVDLDRVPATEQRDGEPYVTPAAVREYAENQRAAQAADAQAVTAEPEATAPDHGGPTGEVERIPYRGVRRTIGEQMERSKYTAPHVTHHDSVDVTDLVKMKTTLSDRAAERGVTLTYLPFVVKAVVAALEEYPILNSQLDEENEEIVTQGTHNIGIATATDAGLMVPVVENAGEKSLLSIAAEANDLVERARDRSISREEMQGGTFTITNFGAIGGEYATPIINYPETAILGLGAIKERPWVVESGTTESSPTATGRVEARHVVTLSLSIDHRVIDGAEAARFTNEVKAALGNPSLLLLD